MAKSSMDIAAECIGGSVVTDLEGMRDKWKATARSLGRAHMNARANMIGAYNSEQARIQKNKEAAAKLLSLFFGLVARVPVQKAMVSYGQKGLAIAKEVEGAFGKASIPKAWDPLSAGAPLTSGKASAETRTLQEVAKAHNFEEAFVKRVEACFNPLIGELRYKAETMKKHSPTSGWKHLDRRFPNERQRIQEVEDGILSWYLDKRSQYFLWSNMPTEVGDAERSVLLERMLWTDYIFGSVPTLHWMTENKLFNPNFSNATHGNWKPYSQHPPKLRTVGPREVIELDQLPEKKAYMTHISKEAVRRMNKVGIPTDLLGIKGAVDTPGESARIDRWAANNVFIMEKGILPKTKRSTSIDYSQIHKVPK
jgi:hypothetical protein